MVAVPAWSPESPGPQDHEINEPERPVPSDIRFRRGALDRCRSDFEIGWSVSRRYPGDALAPRRPCRRTPGRAGAARMNVRKGVPLEDGATCTPGGSDFDTTPISIPMPRQGHAEAPSTRSRSHVAADPSGAARSMGPFKRVGKGFGVPPAHWRDHPGKRGWPLRASHNRLATQIFVRPARSPPGCGRFDRQGTPGRHPDRLQPAAVEPGRHRVSPTPDCAGHSACCPSLHIP
jgi:hypothetical protein